jgi:hypothetical protein
MDCTTADASPSSGDYLQFVQHVEAQNLQYLKFGTSNATSLTLSFWVKSNIDSARLISKTYTINSANTWEKKTITFAGDTVGTINNDNGRGFQCSFWLGAGSDYTSGTLQTSWGSYVAANRAVGQVNLADSTSNEWYITGIQLEAGQVASDFEFLPYDVNLQRCQRYYQVIVDGADLSWGIATQYTASTLYTSYLLRTVMRTAPTLDQVTGTNFYIFYRNSAADFFDGISVLQKATPQYVEWNVSSGISGTGGQAGFLRTGNSATTAFVAFDAEL